MYIQYLWCFREGGFRRFFDDIDPAKMFFHHHLFVCFFNFFYYLIIGFVIFGRKDFVSSCF